MTKMTVTSSRAVHLLLIFICAVFVVSSEASADGAAVDSNKPLQADLPSVSLHLPPLGLRVRDMSATERDDSKLKQGIVVVVAVGASAIAGVREDDIILAVNKSPATGAEQFWLLVDKAKWKCTLQIMRKDKRIEVAIGAKEDT